MVFGDVRLGQDVMDIFLNPSSVAIVGASEDPRKVGNEILRNILNSGYKGKVFPVNPKHQKILGLTTFPSVRSLPDAVDLVVIAIPAQSIPDVLMDCVDRKTKTVIIISGGFRETGEHGKQLEMEILEIARKGGIRIIGPNCQGVVNPHKSFFATFGAFARIPGPIGIISQSGTVSGTLQTWADKEKIGISACINLGNKIDINEIDALNYFREDPNTKCIAMYIESISDGGAFIKAARETSKIKPIVVLKGGKTRLGSKAALSHTGSLAGSYEIFEAALKKAGCIKANSLEELYDLAKALSLLPLPNGNGVLIIGSTGGACILAADTCERFGLQLPDLKENIKEELRNELSGPVTLNNPVDLTTDAFNAYNYKLIIEKNKDNDDYGSFLAIFGDPIVGAAEAIDKASGLTIKPICVAYFGGGDVERDEIAKMNDLHIPVFPSPERAVNALAALVKYSEIKKRLST